MAWRRPWPLTARVPVVAGTLILVVAIALSHAMMSIMTSEQELGVRRLAAVYLDGISTTIYPHLLARNLTNITEALHRTMWFHQSMREQRAIVTLPDGSLFADVSGPDQLPMAGCRGRPVSRPWPEPLPPAAGQRLRLRLDTGTGWASRAIVRNGNHIGDLYVALELKPLIEERHALRRKLLVGNRTGRSVRRR